MQSEEHPPRRRPAVTAGWGALIGLLGAGLVAFSAWLAWVSGRDMFLVGFGVAAVGYVIGDLLPRFLS